MKDDDQAVLDPTKMLPRQTWLIEPTEEDLTRVVPKVYTGGDNDIFNDARPRYNSY